MRQFKRAIAAFILPFFMVGMMSMTACDPDQVNTAKNVITQANFYIDIAEGLIKVASNEFASKPKVKTAMDATAQALVTVKAALVAAQKGLDKDNVALKAAIITLAVEVFALTKAINEAKDAAKAGTP